MGDVHPDSEKREGVGGRSQKNVFFGPSSLSLDQKRGALDPQPLRRGHTGKIARPRPCDGEVTDHEVGEIVRVVNCHLKRKFYSIQENNQK